MLLILAAIAIAAAVAVGAPPAAPVESCAPPDADPLLVRDAGLDGAIPIGPLVLYPTDGFPVRGRRVMGPKAVMITTEPVTVIVGRSARRRFSLLFAGATTGRAGIGFRGGFLYRGAQCVPITVRPDAGPTRHATLAIGRAPSTCR